MDKTTYSTYRTICEILQDCEDTVIIEVTETLAASIIHAIGRGEQDDEAATLFFDDVKDMLKRYNSKDEAPRQL